MGVDIRGAGFGQGGCSGLLRRGRPGSVVRGLCLCSSRKGGLQCGSRGLAVIKRCRYLPLRWFRCWRRRPLFFTAGGCLGLACWCLGPGCLDAAEISVHLGDVGNLRCPFFMGRAGRRRLGDNEYGRVVWGRKVGIRASGLLRGLGSTWPVWRGLGWWGCEPEVLSDAPLLRDLQGERLAPPDRGGDAVMGDGPDGEVACEAGAGRS